MRKESHSWMKNTAGDIFIKFLRLYPQMQYTLGLLWRFSVVSCWDVFVEVYVPKSFKKCYVALFHTIIRSKWLIWKVEWVYINFYHLMSNFFSFEELNNLTIENFVGHNSLGTRMKTDWINALYKYTTHIEFYY